MEQKYTPEGEKRKELLAQHFEETFIGGALADAFGMPIEGWRRDQISKYVGTLRSLVDPQEFYAEIQSGVTLENDFPFKFTTRALDKGEYTDDTYLSIAVARSIINAGGFSLEQAAVEHVVMAQYLQGLPKKDNWESFGKATRAAIQNLEKGVSPYESGILAPSPGNGPAIKAGPVGLYMSATGKYQEGITFAQQLGEMTHKSPASVASGIAQAHAVYAMSEKISREGFVNSIVDVVQDYESTQKNVNPIFKENLKWVRDNAYASVDNAYDRLGSKFSVESNYPLTLFMVQKYWDTPFNGLVDLVNLGGDADSTGAMYGTLVGARGVQVAPDSWKIQLKEGKILKDLAKSLSIVS